MEKRLILDNIKTNYWISDDGRMRNEKTNNWLYPHENGTQMYWVIYFRGKQKVIYAKQIIANMFVPNPNNYKYVTCKDGDYKNICAWNLEWRENTGGYGCERKNISIKMPDNVEVKQFRNSRYGVSKDGHIYSIPKKIQLHEEYDGNKKYARVQLYHNINKKMFVHRIVWECYKGVIPDGYEIDHVDNNPLNNSLDNLQLITHKENLSRRKLHN